MYSEEYYLLIMDIITKPYLVLLIFLGLSYSVSYAIIPNVPDKLSVKISFPPFNQQVPLGELPVFGSSSDNESANCEVYLDWNNDNAFHQARAAGPGGYSDFSTWIYVYSEKNHLIVNGTNDLTAKMLCSVDNNFNLTRYNSIKIIGNDKGEQKMLAVHNSSVLGKYGQLNHYSLTIERAHLFLLFTLRPLGSACSRSDHVSNTRRRLRTYVCPHLHFRVNHKVV